MSTKVIPIHGLVTSYTQAEEDILTTQSNGQPANKMLIYNSDLGKARIWNGTSFENCQLLNSDGSLGLTFFNQSGGVSVSKVMAFTVAPNVSSGYSIDISRAGFANVLGYSIIAIRNTATATSSPNVSVKSVTTSAIVVNITEGSTNLVTLLSVLLLSGAPDVFSPVSGLTLNVIVFGN